ncbi:MAG: hypothetical protein GXO63_01665 [Candidatus Micrarchaeota archaeon]|nr:hypothetical protein [Candidatus Micrarchaeota archaeon]
MRGQSGVEFLVVISILFVFSAIIVSFVPRSLGYDDCSLISLSIDSAYANSTRVIFSVPQGILVGVYPGEVFTDSGNGPVFCPLTVRNVSRLTFFGGKVAAYNLNGKVYVLAVSTEKDNFRPGETVNISVGEFVSGGFLMVNFSNGSSVLSVFSAENYFTHLWIPQSEGTYILKAFDNLTGSQAERIVVVR